VWLEQGWLGVLALGLLAAAALLRGAALAWRGQAAMPQAMAAALAFLTVGLLNTLVDEPRFLMLLLVLLWLAAVPRSSSPPARAGAAGRAAPPRPA
jgi:O-antigen ligase